MRDERRRSPRTSIRGARISIGSASGDHVVGRGIDLGRGGLFVQSERVLAVGKHLVLEIQVPGELAPWSAAGRVAWNRSPGATDPRPSGMGVAFTDIDRAVLAAIDRLLRRAPDTQAAAEGPVEPPARERTVLGVGLPTATPATPVPILQAAPSRETTVLGVAPAPPPPSAPPPAPATVPPPPTPRVREAPKAPDALESASQLPDWPDEPPPPPPERPVFPAPAERSLAFDLVAKADAAPAESPAEREPSWPPPAGVPRRGGKLGRIFLLLMAVAGAAGGYTFRAQLRPWISGRFGAALAPAPGGAPGADPSSAHAGADPASGAVAPGAAAAGPLPSPLARPDAGLDAGRAAPAAKASIPAPPTRRPGAATLKTRRETPAAPAAAPPAATAPAEATTASAPTGDNPYE